MAFGISPDTLALRPSTVLQDIIQKKQLAQREREAATNERLALKRIAQREKETAEQSRQFEISQASRGALTDHQKWLQDNWGQMTEAQKAAEARKAEQFEIEKAQAVGMKELFTQPEVVTPEPASVQEEWKGIPYRLPPEKLPDSFTMSPEELEKKYDIKRGGVIEYTLKKAPAPTAYTPPKDLAGYLEQFPDRKANLEEAQNRIKPLKLTAQEEMILSQQTVVNNPTIKDPVRMRVKIAVARREEIKARRKANSELRIGIRDEHNAMREEMKPTPLTYAQKQKVKTIKTVLKHGSYLTKGVVGGKLKRNQIKSLDDAIEYITFEGESPDKFAKELEKYGAKDNETLIQNNMRVYGKSRKEVIKAMKAQGLL